MELLSRLLLSQRRAMRSDGHDHDVAILLAEGTALFECGGPVEVTAPGLFFIPAHAPHALLEERDGSGWAFSGLPLNVDARRERLTVPLSSGDATHLISLFGAIEREATGHRPHRETALGALRTLVGVEITRARRAALQPVASKLAAAAMDAIAVLAARPVKPRDIARTLGVTPAHLSHQVSRATGRTVSEWIAEARVTRVKELLIGTDRSLAEIAEELHYSDATQLAREFKRISGVPPGLWRTNSAC